MDEGKVEQRTPVSAPVPPAGVWAWSPRSTSAATARTRRRDAAGAACPPSGPAGRPHPSPATSADGDAAVRSSRPTRRCVPGRAHARGTPTGPGTASTSGAPRSQGRRDEGRSRLRRTARSRRRLHANRCCGEPEHGPRRLPLARDLGPRTVECHGGNYRFVTISAASCPKPGPTGRSPLDAAVSILAGLRQTVLADGRADGRAPR